MPNSQKPFYLFVYGTLMDPLVFRAVLGGRFVFSRDEADGKDSFWARDAILSGYKKVSPDNTYLYAVPDPFGRIRGYLIGPLPVELLASLRQYEGRNYSRRTVVVHTDDGTQKAVIFLANVKQLSHSFGYEFHDPLKQEVLLRRKIELALLEAQREQLPTDDLTTLRAVGELHGPIIRDLVRRHFEAGGISDYAIKRALKDDPLRDFSRIRQDNEALALAPHYLALVVRQVIFNQFEERIHREFRYELDHMSLPTVFYERAISSLIALRMLNTLGGLLDLLAGDALHELDCRRVRLVDFIRWAIVAADALYDNDWARHQVAFIRSHSSQGTVPLGAELEFSNIGHRVIDDPKGAVARDARYDGFFYFPDFGLDILTWRLGGHVDDHHEKVSNKPRRGFFELALGNLSIKANLSKPITNDPWLLGEFIREAMRFYDVRPHSLHISLQLRSQHRPVRDRVLPLSALKCLFALGGDPQRGADGQVRITRLTNGEIIRYDRPADGAGDPIPSMLFSDISKRRSRNIEETSFVTAADAGRYVQQFKFLRLAPGISYEPIIMAIKGIQLSLMPGRFLTATQYRTSPRHRQVFNDLMAWGRNPSPLSEKEIESFLTHVRDGLQSEHRGKPAHAPHYIASTLTELRRMCQEFNAMIPPD